jgi:hypothetical protein
MNSIYFDDALPEFAKLIQSDWGDQALIQNFFLRDADGRLTFVVLEAKSLAARKELADKATTLLLQYVDGIFSVATPDELFDERLNDLSLALSLTLHHAAFTGKVFVVDRRLVGADWLLKPLAPMLAPARFVFASIKGGVGRSTALCVLAAHLAMQGKRVLALDLDLEAPGLGNMLLPGDTLPEFGLLDYLVEQHLGKLSEDFFADLVASSWLGGGRGRVDVIPALGSRSMKNPANALTKIARAYLVGADSAGFTEHIQRLLDEVALPSAYDVVLIDARAGLHETSAAAVIGLGAEVLLFGVGQSQTLAGYELLFAHLADLPRDSDDDWRDRFSLVHAKASPAEPDRIDYKEQMQNLMQRYLWPVNREQIIEADLVALQNEFETEWEEQTQFPDDTANISAPEPIVILDDQRFHSFDPLKDRSVLEEHIYKVTFGEFLKKIDELIKND